MEDKFINYLKEKGLSENTYKSYSSDVKKYNEYYMNSYGENLIKIINADVLMYRSYLITHNISPKTINRKISAIKEYNNFLVVEGLQDEIVIKDKDYIKVQETMINKTIPTQQEINKLKHFACRDTKNAKRDFCIISILIYGGLREGELVKLRLKDINLEERFINVIGKGNKFRQVIINSTMYDALEDYLLERNNVDTKNPYLFISQKNKNTTEALNRNFCNRLLNKYKDICKIDNLHPHMLRAYFCSNALHNAGYTIDQVANQAGHSSLNTTKAYLVNNKEDLLTLANKL